MAKPIVEKQEGSIRVDVNLLEKQMNLVSELVLLRNRLLQIATEANERNLNATVHGLNYVTSELRKNVMKTRMQPVSQLFDKLPCILRDLSKEIFSAIPSTTASKLPTIVESSTSLKKGPCACGPSTKAAIFICRLPMTARASISTGSKAKPWPKVSLLRQMPRK